MPELSIIVPVYNVEKYLEKCLTSLANQTIDPKKIEILVINDGSPDNSQKIIDKFSKKYSFIKSFTKENGGLSDARNYGIKKAKGDYIAFVDSDDFVLPEMYDSMLNKIKEGFDLVVCDFNEVYSDKLKRGYSNIEHDLFTKQEVKENMLTIYPSAWNKIYKKSLFENIEFKKKVWFEDVEFLYRLLPNIHSIGVIKEPYYQYVQRSGSITNTKDDRIFNYIENWNGIIEDYKKKDLYFEYQSILEYCYVRYLYATFIKTATKYDKEMFQKAVNEARKNVKEKFPHYRKNKYFYKSIKGIYLIMFNSFIANIYYFKSHKR